MQKFHLIAAETLDVRIKAGKNIFEEDALGYDSWFDKHPILFKNELQAIRMLLPNEGKGLEIGELLSTAGFSGFKYCQTLFSTEEIPEKPISGFGKGSFVVIQAKK